ncbi:MAG: type II toxin-antitoxin system RelE/ParE family toxin [Flavobacteriia bacterium]|nr:type II toxin-antitoxin system RelE/ParE family toxin [Flavobacteriia bacterium]OIP48186.1 MAG: plasmid stabilization protein [Flavobacteriaceae bacterium CG2_30_31_66]PIV97890.1 MAG: type II toxin-antitoxin system RelE/ParE family toxin [Flavobacteriaceae bacterium CG17_big_fil_post_rev_8_21_14_2_50_31_13]PIX12726.1 MAG: type II toxin-antitoxin system RelE/ParE family toxin [Flavobacteriaceae bacterium CG_4_8_14_3_um_filter_31_8]PIY14632.1 MAG: type II toxin-antitoxin system RelE/ParE famil
MELTVFWLELAENKLEDIYCYYLEKAGKKVAQKLVNGIVDATIGIEKQPEIGQIEELLKHKNNDFRYLVYKNYKIIYWINYKYHRIEIANVFDTRQNPEKIIPKN